MPKQPRLVLCGGGTGGHVTPNLAVASALKHQFPKAELLYIGSRAPMDRELVAPSGISFRAVFSGKLRRYWSWRHFVDPFLFLIGFFQSFFILARFWPQAVFSKGGYASLPVVLAAFILRRPVVLHESDGVMGLANRIAARFATKICVSFPDVLPVTSRSSSVARERHDSRATWSASDRVILTGNPLRTDILNGNPGRGYELTGFHQGKPVLLVWGGSQGAEQINRLIGDQFEELTSEFQIIHITGKGKVQVSSSSSSSSLSSSYVAFEYVGEELKHLYAITDLVVGRGGANSLFELALTQKPNIIIPLPNPDQQANALYFEQKGGSIVYRSGDNLSELLRAFWHNEAQRGAMAEALAAIARPHASERIASIILENSKH